MSGSQDPGLFDLLPALYRLRDAQLIAAQTLLTPAEQQELASLQAQSTLAFDQQQRLDELVAKSARGPLQSLLMVVDEQFAAIAENLAQLYDDQFIETCAPWVIPYIGDLIGYQAVNAAGPGVANPRADVAHTIASRQRKGTVLVMEQLARDVTGWGAHAVEMFTNLADAQYMNHVRPNNLSMADIRSWQTRVYMDTGFDCVPHRVDVRTIASGHPRANIRNVGIFLWSLTAFTRTNVLAASVNGAPTCFRFSPFGIDTQLFNNPVSQGSVIATPAGPANVPARLLRRVLCADLRSGGASVYYGPGSSLAVYAAGVLVNAYQLQVCNLSGADGSWINLPQAASAVAIDPELGRIAFGTPPTEQVFVSFCAGFNAAIGGGEYDRSAGFAVQDEASVYYYPDLATPPRYSDLQGALDYAAGTLAQSGQAAVEISSPKLVSPGLLALASLAINVPASATLELRAENLTCTIIELDGEITVTGDAPTPQQTPGTLLLNGLVIVSNAVPDAAGPITVLHATEAGASASPSQLGQLILTDCTFVPGWALSGPVSPRRPGQPTLVAEPSGLAISAVRCILGPAGIAAGASLSLTDSILDASSPQNIAYAAPAAFGAPPQPAGQTGGGALTLSGCTVIGKVHATLLAEVSNSLFNAALADGDAFPAPLWADRTQAGCVRFSYLPSGALTPPPYECVVQAQASPQPLFASLQYGDPDYAKLLACTDDSIRRGADDGGEMGAFHLVLAPLREADLRLRLQEYLPVGLSFGLIYQN